MLVIFSGRSGAGKTTIARALARDVNATYVRIDSIEQALREAGVQVEGEGYAVAYAVAEDNLRQGQCVVADSVNPWPQTREAWRAVAKRAGTTAIDVEIICSDPAVHRARVESRASDIPGHLLPSWQTVLDRDYRLWDLDRLQIDTAYVTVEEAVRLIRATMRV
jgi:predicted kinase